MSVNLGEPAQLSVKAHEYLGVWFAPLIQRTMRSNSADLFKCTCFVQLSDKA